MSRGALSDVAFRNTTLAKEEAHMLILARLQTVGYQVKVNGR